MPRVARSNGRYARAVTAGRVATAILFGLVASACLILAALPAIADAHPLTLSSLFVSLAMLTLSVALALTRDDSPIASLGLGRSSFGPLRIVALAVGTVGASQLVGTFLEAVGLPDAGVSSEIDRALSGAGVGEYALLLAALCLAPGVCEEVLFRGLIQRSVSRISGPTLAILASSLLFGVVHLDPTRAAGAALLGLYLGAVAFRGDSIRPSIACHIANNAAVLAWGATLEGAPAWLLLVGSGAACTLGVVALVTAPRAHSR